MSELDDNTGNVDVEKEAMNMGWTPKEKFKGDPAKWIDAETFVERAEHVLPILRADRDRLKRDLLTRDNEIGNLQQQLGTTNAIVKDLTVQYDERLKAELAAQRRSLKAQLKEAVEDRDVDAEMEVREQLDQLTEAERAAQERAKQNKDKLTEIKVPIPHPGKKTETQFMPKQRWIYEQHFGPIPPGYVVSFKDGDRENFSPDNMILISRAELIKLNQNNYREMPADLKPSVFALSKLQAHVSQKKRCLKNEMPKMQ